MSCISIHATKIQKIREIKKKSDFFSPNPQKYKSKEKLHKLSGDGSE